jgi:hypothetical protein
MVDDTFAPMTKIWVKMYMSIQNIIYDKQDHQGKAAFNEQEVCSLLFIT